MSSLEACRLQLVHFLQFRSLILLSTDEWTSLFNITAGHGRDRQNVVVCRTVIFVVCFSLFLLTESKHAFSDVWQLRFKVQMDQNEFFSAGQ